MLRVPLVQASPGMVLAAPVLQPQRPERVLLRDDHEIGEAEITKLRALHVHEIWVRYPGVPFIVQHISPEIVRVKGAMAGTLRDVLTGIQRDAGADLDYAPFRTHLRSFIHELRDHRDANAFVETMAESSQPLLRHASEVCHLTLLLGMKLQHYLVHERPRLSPARARELVGLGLAALLHDIGMAELEEDTINQWIQQGYDERCVPWRKHVLIGYERLGDDLSPATRAAVLHHHQHYDGSGFPLRQNALGQRAGQTGKQIHIFARILTAADLFDRLRRPPRTPAENTVGDHTDRRPTVRVLNQLQRDPYRAWLDPVVNRALLATVPPFAPGTVVTLSNGQRAAVVAWTPDDPCNPRVRVLNHKPDRWDDSGPTEYDLRLIPELNVAEAEGHNVQRDLFDPPAPAPIFGHEALAATHRSAA